MKTLKQRNRLMKRSGKLVALTKDCEGMLLRADPSRGFSNAYTWLFTVQNGDVYIHFQDLTWSAENHNHWLDPNIKQFIVVDTNFKL